MTDRLDPFAAAPEALKALIQYSLTSGADSVEPSLQHLVKIRASQINGCAICLAMHTGEARKSGESDDRIILLDAWREAGLYTSREMAALEWTEALTRLAETGAPDAAYDAVTREFTDAEVVKLTLLINTINGWNRIGVGFRRKPGDMDRPKKAAA